MQNLITYTSINKSNAIFFFFSFLLIFFLFHIALKHDLISWLMIVCVFLRLVLFSDFDTSSFGASNGN